MTFEDTTPDVNQTAETTTADASSTAQQTAQDSTATQDTTAVATENSESKSVPYERFKEVNDTLNMTRQEIAEMRSMMEKGQQDRVKENLPAEDPTIVQAKEQLKALLKEVAPELGFVSKDEIARKDRDQALESSLSKLEKEWDGSKDPSLKFDRKEVIDFALKNGVGSPEMAFKLLKEKELTDYRIRLATTKTQGVKTEGSDGSGSTNAGTSNDDLMEAIAKGDKNARMTLWKRQLKGAGTSK